MEVREHLNLRGLLRPFVYAISIFFIFFLLTLFRDFFSKPVYFFLSFLGGMIIFLESFFTSYYANRYSEKNLTYFSHLISHTIYPQIFYVGLVIYSFYKEDFFLSFSLALLSAIIYFLYFYLLPSHIHYDHSDQDRKSVV